jgi:hypothetical protein
MFLEDEQDDLLEGEEPLEEVADEDEDEEGYLEEEEELEELDVDDRGHVRPRRSRRDELDEEPQEY